MTFGSLYFCLEGNFLLGSLFQAFYDVRTAIISDTVLADARE